MPEPASWCRLSLCAPTPPGAWPCLCHFASPGVSSKEESDRFISLILHPPSPSLSKLSLKIRKSVFPLEPQLQRLSQQPLAADRLVSQCLSACAPRPTASRRLRETPALCRFSLIQKSSSHRLTTTMTFAMLSRSSPCTASPFLISRSSRLTKQVFSRCD